MHPIDFTLGSPRPTYEARNVLFRQKHAKIVRESSGQTGTKDTFGSEMDLKYHKHCDTKSEVFFTKLTYLLLGKRL
jgi:hypothetical protein